MSMRIMALWFPDWPVHAVRMEQEASQPDGPMAVVGAGRFHGKIWVCDVLARRAGVRRGMRVRAAQALCPTLSVMDYDIERDARVFEAVAQGLDMVTSSVEILRPGLVVVNTAAALRYHGPNAGQMLIDAAGIKGVDCFAGIADDISTAVLAARHSAEVPEGGSSEFLAQLPLNSLIAEETLGCSEEVVGALGDLGVAKLGELADLPARAVATRFGVAGLHCHTIATGGMVRNVAPPIPESPLQVVFVPEEPIERVDAAAFAARHLAANLHEKLQAAGLVCQRLKVSAVIGGQTAERIWRTREPLTEQATADRVRWQLDGWLTARGMAAGEADAGDAGAGGSGGDSGGGLTELALEPIETSSPESVGLWGYQDNTLVNKVVSRVQSTLGTDAVLQPRLSGGRGPVERIELVPYGEERAFKRQPSGTWPGRVAGPHPGMRAHPATQIRVLSQSDQLVTIDEEALLSDQPAWLLWGKEKHPIGAWAGPWPVDERWWQPGTARYARLQVIAGEAGNERGWLLLWFRGRWRVEAMYG